MNAFQWNNLMIIQFWSLQGMPSEVYFYGINIIYILPTLAIMGLFVHHVIIPVFYELQIVSTYEVHKSRLPYVAQSQKRDGVTGE